MLYPAELRGQKSLIVNLINVFAVFRSFSSHPVYRYNYPADIKTPASTPAKQKHSTYASEKKPSKRYPEFPLFAHANGQWAKKIRGKVFYFGKWGHRDAAIALYLKQVDDLQA